MIVTVQCVPERLDYIKSQIKDKPAVYSIDTEKSGAFNSFAKMLDIDLGDSDYRLHLQDDVILSKNFWDKLPHIERLMKKKDIHVLSLYAPNRKDLREQHEQGKNKIVEFHRFLTLVTCVFSRKFISLMKQELKHTRQKKHDDVFVLHILRKYKIKAYVHLPSLTQHNQDIKSTMGHIKSSKRESPLFIDDIKI